MEMAKITEGLKDRLTGVGLQFSETRFYNPVQDVNGEWFIGLEEAATLTPEQYAVCEYLPPAPIEEQF